MLEVIPAILEQQFKEIQKKVSLVEGIVDLVQIDVMDNAFVPNQTFSDPAQLATLPMDIELHLMVEKPDLTIMQWNIDNARRIIVHAEAVANLGQVISLIQRMEKKVGIAINPKTEVHEIEEHIPNVDTVLVMGVEPGFGGQQFEKDVLEKIKYMKRTYPELRVAVDGGVNMRTRDYIEEAGADAVSANSSLWSKDDLALAIQRLQNGFED